MARVASAAEEMLSKENADAWVWGLAIVKPCCVLVLPLVSFAFSMVAPRPLLNLCKVLGKLALVGADERAVGLLIQGFSCALEWISAQWLLAAVAW